MLWNSLLIVGGAIGISVLAAYVVDRCVRRESRARYHDVSGHFFAAVGAFYAILVAFVVVAVWEDMEAAKKNTYAEANALPGLYFASTAFSDKDKAAFQDIAVSYARTVIVDEWPELREGQASAKVEDVAKRMRRAIVSMDVETARQEGLYSAMIERVNTINTMRRERLNEAHTSVPRFFWVGLIIGGVLVIGFALFFGPPGFLPHALMIAVLAALVSASLYFTYLMDHPFRGEVAVTPEAFRIALVQMGQTPP
ncbi:DUF4239 domain-containing protein [Crossiella sp. CA-258035]|uniref:bestrophin-like domain n=1 Tax=Crossiella sp. CA-258035 TaxID=2981138 RepID=UPI0024BCFBED|nr:DUF4239 domain-containing protein [Crossiella sp. CA-258035]WHT17239.1 DUF4239 domain-containing protein [Crossiella sp. CA-258035]